MQSNVFDMNILGACLLAIALIFRAAPLCAEPATVEVAAAMAGCEGTSSDREDDDHNQQGDDWARSCHACNFSLGFHPSIAEPLLWTAAVPSLRSAVIITSGALKPPVPPPRTATATIL